MSNSLYVDPSMDNIRDKFKVIKPEDMSYKLVTEDDLPPDYVDDVHSDTTSQISEAAGIILNPASGSSDVESVHPSTNKPHYQTIQVTHVESVDCFYALQNKLTRLYNQMERIIKQHVHNSLEFVQNPEINKIYLFEEKKGKYSKWLRGRLVDIQKNNDEEVSYELFLVDRGSTVVVPDNTLIEATSHIIQIKPFVIQCQLHNPTSSNWSLESNEYFIKLIENKTLNMLIKNTHGQMHEVDLLISTTLGNQTSVVELLLNTYSNVLSSADESYALMSRKRLKICDVKLYPNSVRLTKELSISVVLSFVSNPHRVFVQEARNQRVIQTLREDLQRYYGNNKKVKECAPIEGSYVVVKYQDNVRYRYHRGLIKTVDFHNDIVNVILVDWGKTVNVPTSAIAVLAEQFTKLEIQAIQVKLAHIAPVGSCKMWESNAIEYLNNYVSHKNVLKMTICKEHPLEVVLFEKMGAYDCCINAQLVDLKIASSTGNLSTVSKWPQASESPEQKDSSFIGNLLDSLKVDDDDEEEEVKGTSQLIKVVKVIDPDLIYVSFPARQDSSHALHKELQIHYSNDRVTKHKWDVGEWCVVRNPDNSVYCRGKITEVLPDNRYKVYVMDYVTEHVLGADHIYVHHDYFKKYLDTVYKMCLTGIRPAGGADKWSSTAIETLEKIVERHSQLYATKNGEGINDVFPVDMWYKHYKESGPLDPVHVKYVSVSNILVKLGLAKKTVTEGSKKEIKPETNKESPYHKQELPMADWLPPFPIDKSSFDAQITCAEDITGLLYIRDDDLQEAYETLEKEMKEYFDKDKPSRKTEVWLPNQICTIAYQDYWYRGKIVSVEDATTVTAKMIDFGSTHILTPDDIYVEILYPNIQAMANKIELYNVHSKSGSWLPSDHDTLMEIIKTKAKIVIRDGSTEVPQADVYLYPSGVLLNKQLVRLSSNLYAKNVSVDEGADGLIVVEDEQVVTQSTDEECEAANQVNELKDFVVAELPKNVYTKVTPMTVLNVLSCDTIILTYSGDDYFMNDGLIELIQQNGGDCPVMNDIQKGKPCVCPFSEDNLYYRCRIEDVTNLEFGMVEVYFVDFGNSEGVLVNDVREIPDAWLKEPVFNCKAKLDVEVSNPARRKLLGQKLKKMIMTVQDIQILEKDPLTIKILDSNGDSIFHNVIANIK